jgi:MFS family permease
MAGAAVPPTEQVDATSAASDMVQTARRPGLGAGGSRRKLVAVALVDSFGSGMYVSASVVLFTTVLGLSAARIGEALALGSMAGLGLMVPWGMAADRFGAKRILIALMLWRGAACAALAVVHGFAQFLIVIVATGAAEKACPALTLAVVAGGLSQEDQTRAAAGIRSARNAGFGLGALAATGALLTSPSVAYTVVVATNTVSFATAVLLLRRVAQPTRTAPRTPKAQNSRTAVRRRPAFLLCTVLSGIVSIHRTLLFVALPLWIHREPRLPLSAVTAAVAANTVLVVFLQVRVAKRTPGVGRAGRMLRRAALVLGACGLALAVPTGRLTLPTVAVLLAAVVLLVTLAEMLQAAASWALSLGLAPTAARSRFLTVFNLGPSLMDAVGVVLITDVVLPHGAVAWAGLAVVVAAAGLATPAAVRRAELEASEAGA